MVWNQFAPLADVPPFEVVGVDEGVDVLDGLGKYFALDSWW